MEADSKAKPVELTCFSWDSTCVRPPPVPSPTCFSWDTTCVVVHEVAPVKTKTTTPIRRQSKSKRASHPTSVGVYEVVDDKPIGNNTDINYELENTSTSQTGCSYGGTCHPKPIPRLIDSEEPSTSKNILVKRSLRRKLRQLGL
jgi:hypothetical protein